MGLRRSVRQGLAMVLLGVLLACGGSPDPPPGPGTDPPPGGGSPPGGLPTTTFTAADGTRFGVQTLATGLQIPWSLAFAPDGRLFISERPGRVRVYQNGALLAEPALTLTDAFTRDESGILGLAVHPDFPTTPYVYLLYTHDPTGVYPDDIPPGAPGPTSVPARVSQLLRVEADPATNYTTALAGTSSSRTTPSASRLSASRKRISRAMGPRGPLAV